MTATMTLRPLLHYWARSGRSDAIRQFALLAFIAALLVIVQPFGAASGLGWGRFVYWLTMLCIMAWAIMPAISKGMQYRARVDGMNVLPGAILLVFVASGPMTLIVALIDLAALAATTAKSSEAGGLGYLAIVVARMGEILATLPGLAAHLARLFAGVFAISLLSIGSISLFLAGQWIKAGQAFVPASSVRPALKFFSRLPPAIGTRLVYLRMEDHYVRVVTDEGNALILMRLSDAIAELDGIAGVRAHRSWWVALGEVQSVVRRGKRLELLMSDGAAVPVSASFRPAVEKALGLGPSAGDG